MSGKLFIDPSTGNYYMDMAKSRKSNKGAAKLKKIVAKAKTIYKKGNAGVKWTTAIKRAAKQV